MKEAKAFLVGFIFCLTLIVYAEMGRSPAADLLFEGFQKVKSKYSQRDRPIQHDEFGVMDDPPLVR